MAEEIENIPETAKTLTIALRRDERRRGDEHATIPAPPFYHSATHLLSPPTDHSGSNILSYRQERLLAEEDQVSPYGEGAHHCRTNKPVEDAFTTREQYGSYLRR